jgi:hypothetical protein
MFFATVIKPALRPAQCVPAFPNISLICLIHESHHPSIQDERVDLFPPLPHKFYGMVRQGRDSFVFIVFLR